MRTMTHPTRPAVSAQWPAIVAQRMERVWLRVREALQAQARARADRRVLELAERCEHSQPELAKELRAALAAKY